MTVLCPNPVRKIPKNKSIYYKSIKVFFYCIRPVSFPPKNITIKKFEYLERDLIGSLDIYSRKKSKNLQFG